jgi:pantoate--beta-alanine ligase
LDLVWTKTKDNLLVLVQEVFLFVEIVKQIEKMVFLAYKWHQQEKTIALVPTMGFFHEGHLTLIREARKKADILVVSLFVNPIQFGPKEDLNSYPRNFKKDAFLSKKEGVDVLFTPKENKMYTKYFQTYIDVTKLSQYLCGRSRPSHFKGVVTIIAKLFNIIRPHLAFFGLKDYQQYLIIKQMVEDLNYPTEIIGCPIVREPDGLAMSSRNLYLTSKQRVSALSLFQSLKLAQQMVDKGEKKAQTIIKAISQFIKSHPYTEIDYIRICDPKTLNELEEIRTKSLLAMAVMVGKARLIDNTMLEVKI